MGTQATAFHNSDARSSGKVGRNSARSTRRPLALAAQIARQLGMVPTWPNVQTIRLAFEAEAAHSEISVSQAVALIVTAAQEISPTPGGFHAPASEWEKRQAQRKNDIDRFWFEDARWRTKASYWKLLELLQQESA